MAAPMPTFPGTSQSGFHPMSSFFMPPGQPMYPMMGSTSGMTPPHLGYIPPHSAPHMVPRGGAMMSSGNIMPPPYMSGGGAMTTGGGGTGGGVMQRTDTLESTGMTRGGGGGGEGGMGYYPQRHSQHADMGLQFVEKIVEVPEVQYVEKIVEVVQKIQQEKIVHVPKVEVVERKVLIPKAVYKEKIVEVPQIQYRDVPIEKIVEVPEVQTQVVTREVDVPVNVDVPVIQPRKANVEQEIQRNIPMPVDLRVAQGFEIPKLKPKYKSVPVPIYVPRYIEVPIPAQFINSIQGNSLQPIAKSTAGANGSSQSRLASRTSQNMTYGQSPLGSTPYPPAMSSKSMEQPITRCQSSPVVIPISSRNVTAA